MWQRKCVRDAFSPYTFCLHETFCPNCRHETFWQSTRQRRTGSAHHSALAAHFLLRACCSSLIRPQRAPQTHSLNTHHWQGASQGHDMQPPWVTPMNVPPSLGSREQTVRQGRGAGGLGDTGRTERGRGNAETDRHWEKGGREGERKGGWGSRSDTWPTFRLAPAWVLRTRESPFVLLWTERDVRREILHYLKSSEQSNISPSGTIGHPSWSTDKSETILRRGKLQAGLPEIPLETDSEKDGTSNVGLVLRLFFMKCRTELNCSLALNLDRWRNLNFFGVGLLQVFCRAWFTNPLSKPKTWTGYPNYLHIQVMTPHISTYNCKRIMASLRRTV